MPARRARSPCRGAHRNGTGRTVTPAPASSGGRRPAASAVARQTRWRVQLRTAWAPAPGAAPRSRRPRSYLPANHDPARPDGEWRPEVEISGLAYSSQSVTPGTLFFACPGSAPTGTTSPRGRRARRRRARVPAAARAWGPRGRGRRRARRDGPGRGPLLRRPHRELDVVGITGTNGKTTTAFLVRHLLEAAGPAAGCSARSSRVVGGVRRRSSAPPPRPSTSRPPSADARRPATAPA